MRIINGGGGVQAFEVPGGNMLSHAFTVRLEIKQQNGIACAMEKLGDAGHLRPVGANAVHQYHDTPRRLARHEPTTQRRATGTRKLNRLHGQICRRRSDLAIVRRDEDSSLMPAKQQKAQSRSQENSCDDFKFCFQTGTVG